jgi:hypothetical protein
MTNVDDFNPATASGNFYAGNGMIISTTPVSCNFGEIFDTWTIKPVRVEIIPPITNIIELGLFSRVREMDLNGAGWAIKIGIWYDKHG